MGRAKQLLEWIFHKKDRGEHQPGTAHATHEGHREHADHKEDALADALRTPTKDTIGA